MWSVLLIWLAFHRSWQKHSATHGKTVLFSVKQGVGGGGGLGLDLLHGQVWLCSGLALLSDESANAGGKKTTQSRASGRGPYRTRRLSRRRS